MKNSKSGVLEIILTGIICRSIGEHFRPLIVSALESAPTFVLRMDAAVVTYGPSGTSWEPLQPSKSCGAAWVVPADRYDLWHSYAQTQSKLGCVRNVFIPSSLARAYQYAECQARLAVNSGFPALE